MNTLLDPSLSDFPSLHASPQGSAHSAPLSCAIPPRKGFSLVLALVIMGMMILLVVSLVSFIAIEMQLTQLSTDRQRAQLNANIVGLRLAVAHLQQEAGPDQRTTAQANTTLPVRTQDEATAKWLGKNAYWTGVWDTRDTDPMSQNYSPAKERPPAWLVSGKNQLVSLSGKGKDYGSIADYQTPWQKRNAVSTAKNGVIRLFPNLPDAVKNGTSGIPRPIFETEVSVSSVPLYAAAVGTSNPTTTGHFAYWVADEGVKARLNLADAHSDTNVQSHPSRARLAAATGNAALSLAFGDLPLADSDKKRINLVLDTSGYANLTTVKTVNEGGILPNISTSYAHTVTAASQGVLADVATGGLKQDLSLLFELKEESFDATPFGMNNIGPATLLTDAKPSENGAGTNQNPRWGEQKMNIFAGGVVYFEGNQRKTVSGGSDWKRPMARPVFNVRGVNGTGGKEGGPGNLFGPAWSCLRDYYRQYKATNYENGTFLARTYEPNSSSIGDYIRRYGDAQFGHVVTRDHMGGRWDPHTTDAGSRSRGTDVAIPRPINAAATPQATRCALIYGIQKQGKVIRLVVNPMVVVHNPYDIPVKYREGTTPLGDRAGMRLSLRYNSVRFNFTITKANGGTDSFSKTMLEICQSQDGWSSAGVGGNRDVFSWYVPSEPIPPGEYRAYSPGQNQTVPWSRYIVAQRGFKQLGGYYMEYLRPGKNQLELEEGDSVSVQMTDAGDSYVRELIRDYEPENLGVAIGGDNDYGWLSEHQEFFKRNHDSRRHGLPDKLVFGGETGIPIPEVGNGPPRWFTLNEWIEKYTEWNGINGAEDYEGRNGLDNLPTYAMSNPLSATRRRDGVGWNGSGDNGFGYFTAGTSFQYRMVGLKLGHTEELFQESGGLAFGGNSHTSRGKNYVIRAHVPREPMTSIGQFQTANIQIYDDFPLYGVGHSLSTPWIPADSLYYSRPGFNWTHYDYSYLLNQALWDHFFFSTIAPEIDAKNINQAPREERNQSAVWRDFLAAAPAHKPLHNQTFVLNTQANLQKASTLPSEKDSYRHSAAYLLQNGTFNINSTDERAWRAILGGNRALPVPVTKGGKVNDDRKTPIPRTVPTKEEKFAEDDPVSAALWAGTKALDDKQLEKLAKALVLKIRYRLASGIHDVAYKSLTGETLVRPFFSLGEFINRAVEGADRRPNANSPSAFGVMQAALFQADKDGAAINTASGAKKLKRAALTDPLQGSFVHADSIPDDTIPIATGAPGMILQGDIFQAIGNRLSARSDTFVVRAYGDTVGATGIGAPRGRAWLEAVVQRTPDFVDNSKTGNQPWEWDTNGTPAYEGDKAITAVNRYLGRRFRVVSIRWLSANEL